MGDREEAQVSNEDATSHVFPTRGREVAVSEEELGKPAFQCQVAHKARMGKISKGHGGEMVVCCISQMCGLWYLLESRFRKHLDVYADVCVLALRDKPQLGPQVTCLVLAHHRDGNRLHAL